MTVRVFRRASRMPVPAAELLAWHQREGAFERLAPPWEHVEVLERSGPLGDGMRAKLRMKTGPIAQTWVADHAMFTEGDARGFRDRQVTGPFAAWEHTHRFRDLPGGASELEDVIEYELPMGSAGSVASGFVRRRLERTFAYRHRVTEADLAAGAALRDARGTGLKIAVTGASGLVGSALVPMLAASGATVVPLVRRAPKAGEIQWDPSKGVLDPASFDDVDAVVHLAGESVAGARWTPEQKAKILDSRVLGTRLVAEALAKAKARPRVLISSSAIGLYGDAGDARLDESSPAAGGFLADVCKQWEAATEPAERAGVRVVHARIGIALSPKGGALAQMLTPFKMGVGGRLGSGKQYMSWIAIDDVVYGIAHALATDALSGPVNFTAPAPVTNAELTRTLGRVLGRPAFLPVPKTALEILLGSEVVREAILASARAFPTRLEASGYTFRYPDLESALRHVLGR